MMRQSATMQSGSGRFWNAPLMQSIFNKFKVTGRDKKPDFFI